MLAAHDHSSTSTKEADDPLQRRRTRKKERGNGSSSGGGGTSDSSAQWVTLSHGGPRPPFGPEDLTLGEDMCGECKHGDFAELLLLCDKCDHVSGVLV